MRVKTLLVIATLCAIVFLLAGCNNADKNAVYSSSAINIDESGTLPIGAIRTLQLDGVVERINIVVGTDKEKVHYHLYGSTTIANYLEITSVNITADCAMVQLGSTQLHSGNLGDRIKLQLDVELPPQLYQQIKLSNVSGSMNINGINSNKILLSTVSGDVNIHSISAQDISAGLVSGNLVVDSASIAGKLAISAVSGDIVAKDMKADMVDIDTVSGDISTVEMSANKLDTNTTSGDSCISGIYSALDANSTSGDITAKINAPITSVVLNTVSGDVRLILPKAPPDFGYNISSVSGSLYLAWPDSIRVQGHSIKYGRSYPIKISTTSGDITLSR